MDQICQQLYKLERNDVLADKVPVGVNVILVSIDDGKVQLSKILSVTVS